MKKLVSVLMVLAMSVSLLFQTSAGTFKENGATKVPTSMSYKDIKHFADVVADVRGREAIIVNAVPYNGDPVTWIARVGVASDNGGYVFDDYVITTCPYGIDPVTNTVNTLPFLNVEEGRAIFGTSWYYFGIFDDVTHASCGFGIAERIKRWSETTDLSFTGISQRGIGYTGSYKEICSSNFIEEHTITS